MINARGGWFLRAGTEGQPLRFTAENETHGVKPGGASNYASYILMADEAESWAVFDGGTYGPFVSYITIGSADYAGHLAIDASRGVGTHVSTSGDTTLANGTLSIKDGEGATCDFTSGGKFQVATLENGSFTVEMDGGTLNMTGGTTNGRFLQGTGKNSNSAVYLRGGTLTTTSYFCVGANAGSTSGSHYFELDGGTVNQTANNDVRIGDNGGSGTENVLCVKSGTFNARTDIRVGSSAPAEMTVQGGTVNASNGSIQIAMATDAGKPGVVTLSGGETIAQSVAAGTANDATLTFDGGRLTAAADNTAFIAASEHLSVFATANGGVVDTAGHAITIAEDIENASGETGTLTFTGTDGTATMTGFLNYTGATKVGKRTHLVVATEEQKNALLQRGFIVVHPGAGVSAKGTHKVLSIADGTACTAADLESVTLGAGLEAAVKFIDEDGDIAVTLGHVTQTWSGAAETSLSWNGANWDGGEAWDNGNDAVFATDGAIADVDAAAEAYSLTFNDNTTVSGTATLGFTTPAVSVAAGKTATINAPTTGDIEKTGAGTLELGSSPAGTLTLSEGTLKLAQGATVAAADLTLGTDAAKPVVFDYGGQTLTANPTAYLGAGMNATLTNGVFNYASEIVFNNSTFPSVLTIAKDATLQTAARFTFNTSGVATINVAGGTLKSTANSNNWIMQAAQTGRLDINVTDGGLLEFGGETYMLTCRDGSDEYQSPELHLKVVDSTVRVNNGKSLRLGRDDTTKASATPVLSLAATNSVFDVAYGIYLGNDKSGLPTEGAYTAVFNNCTIETPRFYVYDDRALNKATFDGSTFRFTANGTVSAAADGNIAVASGGLTIDTQSFNGTLAANLGGGGTVTKTGTGTLTVSTGQTGTTGGLTAAAGTLALANGVNVASSVTVKSGAALSVAGNGSENTINSLTLEDGATLKLTHGANGYGTLNVTTLSLPSGEGEKATLDITLSSTPAVATAISVAGLGVTAADLEHLETISGYSLSIDGNGDLAITLEPKTTTWTGAAGDGLWSSAENWDNGVPSVQDTVVFAPANGVEQVSTNDLGAVGIKLLRKNGLGTATIAGLPDEKPKLELNEGILETAAKEGESAITNPFSTARDEVLVKGTADLGGGAQAASISAADKFLAAGTVFTNGTWTISNSERWFQWPVGTVTVAKDATLDFGSTNNKNQFGASQTGEMRLVIDGGTVKNGSGRNSDNTGYYWGNGDNANAAAVMEVKNGGVFKATFVNENTASRNNFLLGRSAGKSGVKGVLCGDGGTFDFAGRVCAGCGGTGVIAVTNGIFKAMNISIGYVNNGSDLKNGHAELSFVDSTLETRGFFGGYANSASSVEFDNATVVIGKTTSTTYQHVPENIFPGTTAGGSTVSYTIGAGGMSLQTKTADTIVTNATTLAGTGGVEIGGAGTIFFTANQSYTGATTVKNGTTFGPNGITLAGPLVLESGALLAIPEIPEGAKAVKVVQATAFSGEGLDCKTFDANGNHYFVSGSWLLYGKALGFTVIVR